MVSVVMGATEAEKLRLSMHIHAGRVLAQAIAKQLKEGESFKKDLAEVKAEIAAARK
jgi:hypothetical protein